MALALEHRPLSTGRSGIVRHPHAGQRIQAAREITRALPETAVVMSTYSAEEDDSFDSLCDGAMGYLPKDTDPTGHTPSVTPWSPRSSRTLRRASQRQADVRIDTAVGMVDRHDVNGRSNLEPLPPGEFQAPASTGADNCVPRRSMMVLHGPGWRRGSRRC